MLKIPAGSQKTLFFCEKGEVNGQLHEVRPSTVNERILRTVEKSSNDLWKVKLQPITLNSASAIGVKYHNNCYIKLCFRGNAIEGQPKNQDKCQGDRRDNLQKANDHFLIYWILLGIYRKFRDAGSSSHVEGLFSQKGNFIELKAGGG